MDTELFRVVGFFLKESFSFQRKLDIFEYTCFHPKLLLKSCLIQNWKGTFDNFFKFLQLLKICHFFDIPSNHKANGNDQISQIFL